MDEKQKDAFSSTYLYKLFLSHKRSVLIILIAAALLAFLFSSPLFITPLYKSTVVLYPTSSNVISKVLVSSDNQKKDMLEFGESEQTEQMLQILSSNRVRDKVIDRFNLMEHYGIKSNSRYPYTKLNKLYDNRIKFRRTEYNAVRITVLDSDPSMAKEIANVIAELYDSTMNAIQKEVAVQAFQLVESEYNNLCNEIAMLEDSLNALRKMGVFDYDSQVEMLSRQLAVELGKGNQQGVKNIQEHLDVLAQYGGSYHSISERLDNDLTLLSKVKTRYDEARVDATEDVPHKFVVTSAYQAERKCYPIRWVIVTITVLATFILLMLTLALFHQFGNFFHPKAHGAEEKTQETNQHNI